jgi:hypothetical protein
MSLYVDIIQSSIVLGVTVPTLVYLVMRRDKFPYTNISPIWVIVTLCSKFKKLNSAILLNQTLALINSIIQRELVPGDPINIDIEITNYLFVHNLMLIPMSIRYFFSKLDYIHSVSQ